MLVNKVTYENKSIAPFVSHLQGALHLNDTVVPQPHLLHLSAERLSLDGAFLMDCGYVSFQHYLFMTHSTGTQFFKGSFLRVSEALEMMFSPYLFIFFLLFCHISL